MSAPLPNRGRIVAAVRKLGEVLDIAGWAMATMFVVSWSMSQRWTMDAMTIRSSGFALLVPSLKISSVTNALRWLLRR